MNVGLGNFVVFDFLLKRYSYGLTQQLVRTREPCLVRPHCEASLCCIALTCLSREWEMFEGNVCEKLERDM